MKEVRLKSLLKAQPQYGLAESGFLLEDIPKNKKALRYIRITDIQNGDISNKNEKFLFDIPPSYLLKKNDILFARSGATVGKTFFFNKNYEATFAGYLIRLKFKHEHNVNYIYHYLNSHDYWQQILTNQTSSTIQNINSDILKNLLIQIPQYTEQTAIANYLDYHTTKIDSEISYLEKKSSLLEEYKQSLIFETVTKGLDKSAPMKDSGIDWIGEIPAHWEVKRVKDFYKLGMGQTIIKEDLIDNAQYPIYSATAEDKYFGYLDKVKNPLKIGDLVIPARGNSIGYVKLVKETCACTQTTIYMKKKREISSDYIYYYLIGNKPQLFFFDDTAIPQITVEQINQRLVLIPDNNEQQIISNYLHDMCSKINKQRKLMKKKIELLKEYKQSLIYEAVTGKIEIPQEFYKDNI